MKEIEGIILKLGTKDLNGLIFSKDCIIDYYEKVPIIVGYDYRNSKNVVGDAKIIRNDNILSIQGEISDESIGTLIEEEIYTYLGFFANKIKKKDNIVTNMTIRFITLLADTESGLDYCKIIKK